jgi:hypothetical protein
VVSARTESPYNKYIVFLDVDKFNLDFLFLVESEFLKSRTPTREVQLEQVALFFKPQLYFSHVIEHQENLIGKDIGTPNVISIWYHVLF